jgi:hypothetical protein
MSIESRGALILGIDKSIITKKVQLKDTRISIRLIHPNI